MFLFGDFFFFLFLWSLEVLEEKGIIVSAWMSYKSFSFLGDVFGKGGFYY